MQPFLCPQCLRESAYDPWQGSARCPYCGYTPPAGGRVRRLTRKRWDAHQPFLDELLSHWDGTHVPEPAFVLRTPQLAGLFFEDYQRALGEDPHRSAGQQGYVRGYRPREGEVLSFVGAYILLRRGERAAARRQLEALTERAPRFVEPWVWLTATTDDPAQRREFLDTAVALEPAHPLARDALAIALGRVAPSAGQASAPATVTAQCAQCGGALHYEPGATEVMCPHCGHQLSLPQVNLLDADGALVSDLQLRRRTQGHVWSEAQRIVRCPSCGAELTMTGHLARVCAFCASPNILVEDSRRTFERPDRFLPFQVNQQQASEAVERALRSGLRGVAAWLTGQEQQVAGLVGIYLPFWAFDGFVSMRTWAEPSPGQPAPAEERTLDGGMMMFDNLLFPGLALPDRALLRRVLPFELSALSPYEPRLLADWPAALYNVDVEVAAEEAHDALLRLASREAGPATAPTPDPYAANPTPVRVGRSFQVSGVTYQLILLPVWIALLQSEEKRGLAVVNGQTGEVAVGAMRNDR